MALARGTPGLLIGPTGMALLSGRHELFSMYAYGRSGRRSARGVAQTASRRRRDLVVAQASPPSRPRFIERNNAQSRSPDLQLIWPTRSLAPTPAHVPSDLGDRTCARPRAPLRFILALTSTAARSHGNVRGLHEVLAEGAVSSRPDRALAFARLTATVPR